MKFTLFGLAVACSLFLCGCQDEEFSRYPSVTIPHYSEADYVKLLSDKNPEVVYNATVFLGALAPDFAKMLSDEKADRHSPEYAMASQAYTAIVSHLRSHDADVVAASLRFLQLFSPQYTARANLLEPVSQFHTGNYLIQFEQVMTLSVLMTNGVHVPASRIREFLHSPSWIVSRNAYALVNNLADGPLQQELIERYKSTADEKEQLFSLTGFSTNASEQVTEFLLADLLTPKSSAVKQSICDVLQHARTPEQVLGALDRNYDKLGDDVRQYLVNLQLATLGAKSSSQLVSAFLSHGYPADAAFLKALNEQLERYRNTVSRSKPDQETVHNLQEVEAALLKNPLTVAPWKTLRNKTAALNAELSQLEAGYDALTTEYTAKLDKLLNKNGISNQDKQNYLTQVQNHRESLKALVSNKYNAAQD